jgi:hypothetical protein
MHIHHATTLQVNELLTPIKHHSTHRNRQLDELRVLNNSCEPIEARLETYLQEVPTRPPGVDARVVKVQRGRSTFERLRLKRKNKQRSMQTTSSSGGGDDGSSNDGDGQLLDGDYSDGGDDVGTVLVLFYRQTSLVGMVSGFTPVAGLKR